MSNFKGAYLRVETPRTIDGTVPLIIDGIQQYKESHLPLSARKSLERKNERLPGHLRHKIEEVGGEAPAIQQKPSKTKK